MSLSKGFYRRNNYEAVIFIKTLTVNCLQNAAVNVSNTERATSPKFSTILLENLKEVYICST
jgi:hypothetical protein